MSGGLGSYFGVDPIIFRAIFVVLAFVGGVAFIAYPILWIFVPRDDGFGNPEPLPVWRLFGRGWRHAADRRPRVRGPRIVLAALVAAAVLFVLSGWVTAVGGGVIVAGVVVVLGLLAIGGALTGRRAARWLVLPALVLALPSGIVAAAGVKFEGGYGERDYRPAGVAALPADGYKISAGSMWIDLRDLHPAAGTTTKVPVHVGVGEATVLVPENVCLQGRAKSGAGVVNVLGHQQNGFDLDYRVGGATSNSPRVELDADVGMGAFEVVHNPDEARFGGPRQSFARRPASTATTATASRSTNRACSAGPTG